MPRVHRFVFALCLVVIVPIVNAPAQQPVESDYYRITTLPIPDDVVLEVSGLGWLDDDRTQLLASTRRGEVWIVDNPHANDPVLNGNDSKNQIAYRRMVFGLHEPLGLLSDPGAGFKKGVYLVQRPELTRIRDTRGDFRTDVVESFCRNGRFPVTITSLHLGPYRGRRENYGPR